MEKPKNVYDTVCVYYNKCMIQQAVCLRRLELFERKLDAARRVSAANTQRRFFLSFAPCMSPLRSKDARAIDRPILRSVRTVVVVVLRWDVGIPSGIYRNGRSRTEYEIRGYEIYGRLIREIKIESDA